MHKQAISKILLISFPCVPAFGQRVEIYGGPVRASTAQLQRRGLERLVDKKLQTPLFGGATASSGGVSDNAFAMLLGGGLDIGFRKGIAFRLVQADWLMTKFGDQTQNSQGRVSAGIVIKF